MKFFYIVVLHIFEFFGKLFFVEGYYLNATGGTFPNSVYQEATFAYQFVESQDVVTYFPLGSGTGKCNIMGYWQTANTNSYLTAATKARDTLICTDKCITPASIKICGNNSLVHPRFDKAARHPLVHFAASDSVLGSADYAAFPDLQMFPAVAGAVVPIYNIPELLGNTLVLSRSTISGIFMGNVKRWNDNRILKDNSGITKSILANLNAFITVVVRTDSSGTSEIFSNGLASFDPCCVNSPDFSFATVIGSGSTPKWCGAITDEVQIITAKNCTAAQSSKSRTITMVVIGPQYIPTAVSFYCNDTAATVLSVFNQIYGAGNVLVSRSFTNSSKSPIYSFTVGYWGAPMTGKNWYLPQVTVSPGPMTVTVSTLQEGGFFNSHFNSSAYYVTPEIQSIWVRTSISATFNLSNPNTVTPALQSPSISTTSTSLLSAVKSALRVIGPSAVSSVVLNNHTATGWVEFQITFNMTKPNPANLQLLVVHTSVSGAVQVTRLLASNNYPLFYNSRSPEGYSGSGQYTCYRHDQGLQAWSYFTGNGNKGVIAAVSTMLLFLYERISISLLSSIFFGG